MKKIVVFMVLAMAILVGNAFAVQSGKTVTWDSPQGKATFDGKIHADKGFSPEKLRDLHFDLLIALTARASGARLITKSLIAPLISTMTPPPVRTLKPQYSHVPTICKSSISW